MKCFGFLSVFYFNLRCLKICIRQVIATKYSGINLVIVNRVLIKCGFTYLDNMKNSTVTEIKHMQRQMKQEIKYYTVSIFL